MCCSHCKMFLRVSGILKLLWVLHNTPTEQCQGLRIPGSFTRMEPRQDGLQAMFPGCCYCCCCGTLQVLSSPTPPSPQFSLAVAPCIHDTRRYLAFLMYFRCLLSEAVSGPFTHSVRGLICLILGLRSGGNNTKRTVEKSVVETQHDALI